MKKPVVRSRSGRSCRNRRSRGEAQAPVLARRGRRPRPRPRSRTPAAATSSFSAVGDRARRVDERAARRQRPRRAGEDPALKLGQAAESTPATCASVRQAERRACRDPSRARPRGCDRSQSRGRPPRRRRSRRDVVGARPAAQRLDRGRARRVDLDRPHRPAGPDTGRDLGGLDPWTGAEVEDPLDPAAGRAPPPRPGSRATGATSSPVSTRAATGAGGAIDDQAVARVEETAVARASDHDPRLAQLRGERGRLRRAAG